MYVFLSSVCLTISSDEEDSSRDENSESGMKSDTGLDKEPIVGDYINEKEPVITDYDEASSDTYERLQAEGVKGKLRAVLPV